MSDGLYTNRNTHSDFVEGIFSTYADPPGLVHIAVAFLTKPDPIQALASRGNRVLVLVRLRFPTSPRALEKLLETEGVQVRYVTSDAFHPKLYLFAQCAVVGSANLTDAALYTNQEVCVEVQADDPRYTDLAMLFDEYWDQAAPLNETKLQAYSTAYRRYSAATRKAEKEWAILGDVSIANIERGGRRKASSELWLDNYRRVYQGFLDAYGTVRRVYEDLGERRLTAEQLPLRLEIDSYLGWLREIHAKGESYKLEPLRTGPDLEHRIRSTVREWLEAEWRWLDEEVVPQRYPLITTTLRSPESIEAASWEQILDAMSCLHSFYDRLRFFEGGHQTHRQMFMERNDLDQVKATLTFLLHGGGDTIERMGRCAFDPAYKLSEFGRSAVQEMVGWVNGEELPICNNRTLRSLRWLGFNVVLVGG